MMVRVVSKYLLSSSRTSSGSRDSDSVVKPTRSTNRTDTCRFSDCDGPGCAGSAIGAVDVAASDAAHCPQKRCSPPTSAPHDGQWRASGAAHCPQNRLPSELSEPQAPHLTAAPPSPERSDQGGPGGADVRLRSGAPMFGFCQNMSRSAPSPTHQMRLIHCPSGCEPTARGRVATDVPAAGGQPSALAVACGTVAQRPASRGVEREGCPTAERRVLSPRTSARWWTHLRAAQLG